MLKREAESELPGDESCPEKTPQTPQNFQEELYSTVSVHCTINAERQACEVRHLLLQHLGLFCRPWQNVRRRTTHQLETSHQQRKSDRNTLKISYLMGCKTPFSQHMDVIQVEMLFTNFFVVQNIAVSAADHGIYSVARFRKSDCKGGPYIYIYTLRSKSYYYT